MRNTAGPVLELCSEMYFENNINAVYTISAIHPSIVHAAAAGLRLLERRSYHLALIERLLCRLRSLECRTANHDMQVVFRRPLLVCIGMQQHSDAGVRDVIQQMLSHPVW